MAKIIFEGEKEFEVATSSTNLLELALAHGINHLHACGGLGRCSTCRVEVLKNPENLSPRTRQEEKFAEQFSLAENHRMACQTQVLGDVTLRRVVLDTPGIDATNTRGRQSIGQDIPMAVLFTDIRDFTQLSSQMPAHDVIHVLNRYFHMLGEVVLRNNGYIHQYYGDGMMVLFGFFARDPYVICLDAVSSALEIVDTLKEFNHYLEQNFGREFRIGVGVHYGGVLSAKIGHPKHKQLTVLGDVVNMASRVESITKITESPVVISASVFQELGSSVLKTRPLVSELKGLGTQQLYEVLGFTPGFRKPKYRLRVSEDQVI